MWVRNTVTFTGQVRTLANYQIAKMLAFLASPHQFPDDMVPTCWARGTIMVWVRILAALGLTLAAGGAQASSFVVLGAPSSMPSVVRLGAPEAVKMAGSSSTPSIVALGEPVPDVTYEKVAAIPSQPKHDFMQSPMIIRGGIVGDAFAKPAPSVAPAATTAVAAPGAATRSDKKISATNSPPEPATPQPTPIPEIDQAR
ncbi:conserved hypothetical protein [Mesorhizobium delmotii]|uniref:Uncharacterized protein n=2 Tax=Mesorhizobium delmotii TaxID=1631247 RepID=A0A2P9AEL5_9HYPH|nr:conserved hypothetical protein [Mesorhizobium delmotii]